MHALHLPSSLPGRLFFCIACIKGSAMDIEFVPPKLNPGHPTVTASSSAGSTTPGGQQAPSVTVALPTPHPGITLIGPPPSAGVRPNWTQPTLRPIETSNDQALLYVAAS